jgi:RNA polymerase sigma-70 factor (ECF subfamily)
VCTDCPTGLAADVDQAFPTLVAHHQDLVYGLAMRLTRRPADAEDLAQEAFVRAYRALRAYAPERRVALHTRGWLAAITLNLARNRARTRRVRPAEASIDALADVTVAGALGPEAIAVQQEAARAWRERIGALPPRYGHAVWLRHVQGLPYPELAEALGRPVNTVKSDVHRGLALLRRALVDEGEVER